MKLGIPRPAAAMLEARDHQPLGVTHHHPVMAPARQRGVVLQVGETGLLHSRDVRRAHRGPHRRTAQAEEHRHRLGRRERRVEARHTIRHPPRLAQGIADDRMAGLAERQPQRPAAHLAGDPRRGRTPTRPTPRRLTRAGVVVLQTARDLTRVVLPRAGAHPPDAQHRPQPPRLVGGRYLPHRRCNCLTLRIPDLGSARWKMASLLGNGAGSRLGSCSSVCCRVGGGPGARASVPSAFKAHQSDRTPRRNVPRASTKGDGSACQATSDNEKPRQSSTRRFTSAHSRVINAYGSQGAGLLANHSRGPYSGL